MTPSAPALIAIALVLAAGPALAQPVRALAEREARLAQRIDESVDKKLIDESEGLRLRERLRKTRKLEAYYRSRHALTPWERRDLERRLKALGARLSADERSAHRR